MKRGLTGLYGSFIHTQIWPRKNCFSLIGWNCYCFRAATRKSLSKYGVHTATGKRAHFISAAFVYTRCKTPFDWCDLVQFSASIHTDWNIFLSPTRKPYVFSASWSCSSMLSTCGIRWLLPQRPSVNEYKYYRNCVVRSGEFQFERENLEPYLKTIFRLTHQHWTRSLRSFGMHRVLASNWPR